MMKWTVFVCLMIVGAAYGACDSCGAECRRACGTRRFRACCFNYLRRKRGDETWSPKEASHQMQTIPAIFLQYVSADFVKNLLEDNMNTPDEIQEQAPGLF